MSKELKEIAEIHTPAADDYHDIYLMGICGTGMAGLAGLLKQKGYNVRGSDSQAYPPMGDLLKKLKIPVYLGYGKANLSAKPDLVIIGNVIRRDNPEAAHVLSEGIPYMSFPQALSHFFLHERTPLVVAGTHGKTTTSSLLVSALTGAGQDPGFMIGGVLNAFESGFRLGSPPWFVIEGDEYDTAFFDKQPKFIHYMPKAAILTSIEFDHADIYPDLDAVKAAFIRFAKLIPQNGLLVACADWPAVKDILQYARCRVVTYGKSTDMDYCITSCKTGETVTKFSFMAKDGPRLHAAIPLPGRHNALNALGVAALLIELGFETQTALHGLGVCSGVKRRQEVRGVEAGVAVIDDFAHHPTAVKETILALKERYAGRRIIAVFEPRTNTSRRAIFQNAYPEAFLGADMVMVRETPNPEKSPPGDRFSSQRLVDDLRALKIDAAYFPDADAIVNTLVPLCREGDVVVVFSNGAFEGIHERLLSALKDKSRSNIQGADGRSEGGS
ncbi:MAG: UDP-N-acetylmuramate--L-alanine ligase [Dissulfurimicrobium sp.]|uniref:UDP-N-acetylmuramate--L-alanine ligase n=1 Tax=Dissulfurimicrobium sp. TaxID=2022436 RepID=UPI00404B0600